MAKDPVCGMTVNEQAALHAVYQGQTYYFCSALCRNLFQREPEKYLLPADKQHKEQKEK